MTAVIDGAAISRSVDVLRDLDGNDVTTRWWQRRRRRVENLRRGLDGIFNDPGKSPLTLS